MVQQPFDQANICLELSEERDDTVECFAIGFPNMSQVRLNIVVKGNWR